MGSAQYKIEVGGAEALTERGSAAERAELMSLEL